MGSELTKAMPKATKAALAELDTGLVLRAQSGDKQALARTLGILKRHPELWEQLHADLFTDEPLLSAAGDNELARESMRRELAKLRRSLADASAPKLERLIAEQAARCWLHLRHLEAWQAKTWSESQTLVRRNQLERLVSRAEGRYLRALRTLAQVRRLPAVAVNVDARQVHVAGAGPAEGAGGSTRVTAAIR